MIADQTLFLTQIAFVVIIAIPSVFSIGVMVYVAWRFLPIMVDQVQKLIDNNAELTKIAKQNTDQIQTTETALVSITPELVKQTNAIETQTVEIKTQSLDLRNYQTLVSDNMAAHSSQIEANTSEIKTNTASIVALQAAFDALPRQLLAVVQNELACAGIIKEIQALRYEVAQVINQQQGKRITGSVPKVSLPSTGKPDTP